MIIAQEKPNLSRSKRGLAPERHFEEVRTVPKQKKAIEKQKILWKEKMILTTLVVSCFALALIVAYYYAQLLVIGYQSNQLKKELTLIEAEGQSLEADINRLSSLDRVEIIATTKLGMVKPSEEVVMIEKNNQSPVNYQLSNAGEQSNEKSFTHRNSSNEMKRHSLMAHETSKEKRNQIIQVFTKLVERLGKCTDSS